MIAVLYIAIGLGTGFLYSRGIFGDAFIHEYESAVVASFLVDFRDEPHHTAQPLVRYTKNSDRIVIGLPFADLSKGYAWLIANPATDTSRIKLLPEGAQFRLTAEGLTYLQKAILLDAEVLTFLKQHISE